MTENESTPKKIDVSFVIPCFNSQETITDTITSINSQAGSLSREIVVIDSSSHEKVKEAINQFPQVKYIHNPVRLYPGQARNLGANIIEGEYLAFIDADVTIQENWLVRLYSRLISIPDIKAAGSVIFNANPEITASTVLYWIEFSQFLPGSRSGFRSFLSSSNLLFRRKDFLDSPGFDLSFAMSEDMLLSRFFEGKLYLDNTTSSCHRHRTEKNKVQDHLKNLGYWSGRLRLAGKSRGAFLSKVRWLSLLLPFYRTAVVMKRVIQNKPRQILKAVTLLPLVFGGTCYWAAGFFNGLKFKQKPAAEIPATRG